MRPTARSGHSACVVNSKVHVFGGILELTKELNDMVVFDTDNLKYTLTEDYSAQVEQAHVPEASKSQSMTQNQQEMQHTQTQNIISPSKTRRNMSPSKRHTSPRKSPNKKPKDAGAEGGAATSHNHNEKANNEGLTSPTSVSMRDSFIIKNADESFDLYYAQMRKRKHQGNFNMHNE